MPDDPYNLKEIERILERYGGSYHAVIGVNGEIISMLSPNQIAYHAGISRFMEHKNFHVNRVTLGYAYLGKHEQPPTYIQYEVLANLLRDDMQMFGFRPNCILGHDQIAGPAIRGKHAKKDPGPLYSWIKFYRLLCRE